jgi:hypothetical protein
LYNEQLKTRRLKTEINFDGFFVPLGAMVNGGFTSNLASAKLLAERACTCVHFQVGFVRHYFPRITAFTLPHAYVRVTEYTDEPGDASVFLASLIFCNNFDRQEGVDSQQKYGFRGTKRLKKIPSNTTIIRDDSTTL